MIIVIKMSIVPSTTLIIMHHNVDHLENNENDGNAECLYFFKRQHKNVSDIQSKSNSSNKSS